MDYVKEIEGLTGIYLVDTAHFGLKGYGAAYILSSPAPAIIEAGLSYSGERVLGALKELGIPSEDVRYIMVSHIHLDHAGGAGPLSEACPNATVVVHERGAKHLIRPSYLLRSVREATGPMFHRYGEVIPIPAPRVLEVEGGEMFSLGGGFKIETIATPGHASHHLCFYEHQTGVLFTGDAAGIYWSKKDRLLPTTPPPSFDLEQSLRSLELLQGFRAGALLYTHFGPHRDPQAMLQQYGELLREWVREIKELKHKLNEDGAVKLSLLRRYAPLLEGYYEGEMVEHELAMNVLGVLRYLSGLDLGHRGG